MRDSQGETDLANVCVSVGCNVVRNLGDPQHQVFLVIPLGVSLDTLLARLEAESTVVDAEVDQLITLESPL